MKVGDIVVVGSQVGVLVSMQPCQVWDGCALLTVREATCQMHTDAQFLPKCGRCNGSGIAWDDESEQWLCFKCLAPNLDSFGGPTVSIPVRKLIEVGTAGGHTTFMNCPCCENTITDVVLSTPWHLIPAECGLCKASVIACGVRNLSSDKLVLQAIDSLVDPQAKLHVPQNLMLGQQLIETSHRRSAMSRSNLTLMRFWGRSGYAMPVFIWTNGGGPRPDMTEAAKAVRDIMMARSVSVDTSKIRTLGWRRNPSRGIFVFKARSGIRLRGWPRVMLTPEPEFLVEGKFGDLFAIPVGAFEIEEPTQVTGSTGFIREHKPHTDADAVLDRSSFSGQQSRFNVGQPNLRPVAPFNGDETGFTVTNPHFGYRLYLGDVPGIDPYEINLIQTDLELEF